MKTDYPSKSKVMLLVLIGFFTLIALLMILPFLRTIIAAVTAGFIFLPLYKVVKKVVRFDWLASTLILFVIFFFLVVPLLASGILLAQELSTLADLSSSSIQDLTSSLQNFSMPEYMSGILSIEDIQEYVNNGFSNLAFRSTQWIDMFLANALNFSLALLIFIFVTFFFLKDYDKLHRSLNSVIDSLFEKRDSKKIKTYLEKVGTTLNAVIRGTIIMTLIQSALLIPLYYALGLQTPLLWAILTFFVALLPMIGTTLIWVPLTTIVLIKAVMAGDTSMIIISIISFGWGTFVANVDNVLRPAIIGQQGNIHPLTILIGILGGIKVFGVAGIFVGPVILTAAFLFIEMFLIANEEEETPEVS